MKDIMTNDIVAPIDPENPTYYIDKPRMREALAEYRDACLAAEAEGKEIPRVPEYLGDCFLKIAKGLSMNHNFRNYSYVQEMIGDGVYTCLKYIRRFDPDKISERTGKPVSAFSYFTQTCFYAFVNRIKDEKYETNVKWKILLESDIDTFSMDPEEASEFRINMAEFISSIGPYKAPETSKKKKKGDVDPDIDEEPSLDSFL